MLQPQVPNFENVFTLEIVRHGAKAHTRDNVPPSFFGGVGKGQLTEKGKRESYWLGVERKNEYIKTKKQVIWGKMLDEVVSFSIDKERSLDSARYMLEGMYPLENLKF